MQKRFDGSPLPFVKLFQVSKIGSFRKLRPTAVAGVPLLGTLAWHLYSADKRSILDWGCVCCTRIHRRHEAQRRLSFCRHDIKGNAFDQWLSAVLLTEADTCTMTVTASSCVCTPVCVQLQPLQLE